jgi:hypothetical protein
MVAKAAAASRLAKMADTNLAVRFGMFVSGDTRR